MSKPVLRLIERNGFCRGCDKELIRNQDQVIYMYSFRNRGMTILICLDCVNEIAAIAGLRV